MEAAKKQVQNMILEGADIIDVGGESTRPGHKRISDEEEIQRVSPIIEMIRKEFDVPVSLDTYKSGVAEAGIKAGAGLINDIWGLKFDEKMAGVIAKNNVSCCLMHNRDNKNYSEFMQELLNDLEESVDLALGHGIKADKIILDPGVGFAKSYEQNLLTIKKHQLSGKTGLSNSFRNIQKIRNRPYLRYRCR